MGSILANAPSAIDTSKSAGSLEVNGDGRKESVPFSDYFRPEEGAIPTNGQRVPKENDNLNLQKLVIGSSPGDSGRNLTTDPECMISNAPLSALWHATILMVILFSRLFYFQVNVP